MACLHSDIANALAKDFAIFNFKFLDQNFANNQVADNHGKRSPKRAKTGVLYQRGQRRSCHHKFTLVKVLTLKLSETSTLTKTIAITLNIAKKMAMVNHNVERLAKITLVIVLDNHYNEKSESGRVTCTGCLDKYVST